MKSTEKKINFEKTPEGVFMVNALAIVYDTSSRKILIGKRVNDLYVKKLGWSFPGGNVKHGEECKKSIKRLVKSKTNLDVVSLGIVYARIPKENKKLMILYCLSEVTGGKEKAKGDFKELKWVRPDELEKYFSTSFSSELKEYIMNLK